MTAITSFTGDHAFLSSFHPCRIKVPGGISAWPSAEHLFQGTKAPTQRESDWIRSAPSAAEARRRGRSVELGGWWEREKRRIMLEIVLWKFTQHDDLRDRLVNTGQRRLIEGNTWDDIYWGAVAGPIGKGTDLPVWANEPAGSSYVMYGHNWLGRILMMVREVLA